MIAKEVMNVHSEHLYYIALVKFVKGDAGQPNTQKLLKSLLHQTRSSIFKTSVACLSGTKEKT